MRALCGITPSDCPPHPALRLVSRQWLCLRTALGSRSRHRPSDVAVEWLSAAALDHAAGELRSASVADYRQQLTSIAAVDADQRFSLEKRYLIGQHGFGAGATATTGGLVSAIADRARNTAARTR